MGPRRGYGLQRLRKSRRGDETLGAHVALIRAGQQAELHGELTSTRGLSNDDMARAMAWRDGILYFENRRLEEVVAELSRYSPVHFVIDNEALRQLPIGGTFQASPQGTEAFLAMLEQGLGLKVRRDGDSIHIEPAVPNRAN